MPFAQAQDARKHVERTEIIYAGGVDELNSHLSGDTQLQLDELALRRCAEWVVEQQHAGLAVASVLVPRADTQMCQGSVEQNRSGHFLTAGE
jgi:hypothetical protein